MLTLVTCMKKSNVGKPWSHHWFTWKECFFVTSENNPARTKLYLAWHTGLVFGGHLWKNCAKLHIFVHQGKPWYLLFVISNLSLISFEILLLSVYSNMDKSDTTLSYHLSQIKMLYLSSTEPHNAVFFCFSCLYPLITHYPLVSISLSIRKSFGTLFFINILLKL